MKKLNVNKEACIGCGACVAIDPEHFDFGDDNYSEVISDENIMSDEAQNAIATCPTKAISYVESDEEKCDCDHCENGCCNRDEAFDNDEYDEAAA